MKGRRQGRRRVENEGRERRIREVLEEQDNCNRKRIRRKRIIKSKEKTEKMLREKENKEEEKSRE